MNQKTSETIESLERQLLATQAEVDALRESIAQIFQYIGKLEVKITK
jgi:septal ring factor EnvC (AmiA/AmiB activator)